MKVACIVYHRDVLKIYPQPWIDEAVRSIREQTFQDFTVLEMNYGGGQERFTDGQFFSMEFASHIGAMDWLITYAFDNGFDVVFNTNLDDISHTTRFEKQLAKIAEGYQLVSSNFYYFGDVEKEMDMVSWGDIGKNLNRGHNVICHPAIAMHKSFWGPDLHYNELLGFEDLDLWKRAYAKGKKFFILPDYLLFYRRHSNQIVQKYGINGKK